MRNLASGVARGVSAGEAPGRGERRASGRVRVLLLVVIGLLYAVSIPWYRESGEIAGTVLGLPDWVALALGCYVLVAVLNCIAWLLTDLRDPGEGEP